QIYGADIDRDILFEEERIRTFWTDQRDPEAIRNLWGELDDVTFDMIVDDGLHEASANLCFLMESFARVKPGGLYVIEDILPQDVELIDCAARVMAPVCTGVVLELLAHPRNWVDNRLLILQRK